MQIITLTSTDPSHDGLFLSNYATLRLRDTLSRVSGVADVNIFGVGQYSMRVWLDPQQMRQRGLNPADVVKLINQQVKRISAGQTGSPPTPPGQQLQLTVTVDNDLTNPTDFGDLIVSAATDGSLTRLRDVARLELGSQNYNQGFTFDGNPSGGIAIFQLPEANALDTAAAVVAEMERMAPSFPKGMSYTVPLDTTLFVTASIDEVYSTLIEAGILVLIVILVFLQDWRATLVPATTVPITIIGAFAAMAALGFGINLLTLFALVLCIGIVVDDAIVVVEGVAHQIDSGKNSKQAAMDAMGELMGPIIGITLVLIAVFLPAAFIPGITGQMYRQFALVIAATALISGINAITLKPTQSAKYLRPHDPHRKQNSFTRGFNALYSRFETQYVRLVSYLLKNSLKSAGLALALILISALGFVRIPTAFIPTEDQGYVLIVLQLPDAASLERTEALLQKIVRSSLKISGVAHAIGISGVSALDNNTSLSNAGLVYLVLDDWSKRGEKEDLRSIYQQLVKKFGNLPEAEVLVLVPPPINGLGLSGGFQMQIQLKDGSGDFAKLSEATQALLAAARADPRIQQVFTPSELRFPNSRLQSIVPGQRA